MESECCTVCLHTHLFEQLDCDARMLVAEASGSDPVPVDVQVFVVEQFLVQVGAEGRVGDTVTQTGV